MFHLACSFLAISESGTIALNLSESFAAIANEKFHSTYWRACKISALTKISSWVSAKVQDDKFTVFDPTINVLWLELPLLIFSLSLWLLDLWCDLTWALPPPSTLKDLLHNLQWAQSTSFDFFSQEKSSSILGNMMFCIY